MAGEPTMPAPTLWLQTFAPVTASIASTVPAMLTSYTRFSGMPALYTTIGDDHRGEPSIVCDHLTASLACDVLMVVSGETPLCSASPWNMLQSPSVAAVPGPANEISIPPAQHKETNALIRRTSNPLPIPPYQRSSQSLSHSRGRCPALRPDLAEQQVRQALDPRVVEADAAEQG